VAVVVRRRVPPVPVGHRLGAGLRSSPDTRCPRRWGMYGSASPFISRTGPPRR
jgi:hypothetical protein